MAPWSPESSRQPGNDGFSGVAPAARLLSIRAMSTKFSPRTSGGDPQLAQATLDVAVLAGAIVHAADLGAKVINVSTITCLPADRMVDQAALGAAIRYAAVDKDAVIVRPRETPERADRSARRVIPTR